MPSNSLNALPYKEFYTEINGYLMNNKLDLLHLNYHLNKQNQIMIQNNHFYGENRENKKNKYNSKIKKN